MRIKELEIKNFKNIGIEEPCKIVFPDGEIPDFISIIGENNIGKSSILEALRLMLPGYISTPDINMFPSREIPSNQENFMEIELIFDGLDEFDLKHKFIKPYVYDNLLRIKRTWHSPNLKDIDAPFKVFMQKKEINELKSIKTWNSKSMETISLDLLKNYEDYCEINDLQGKSISKNQKDSFIDFVATRNPELISLGEAEWKDNPNGIASNLRSILPKIIYVPAVKVISDEASAQKSKSAANSIAAALFERFLNNAQEVSDFQNSIAAIRNLFSGDTTHEEIKKLQIDMNKKLNRVMNGNIELDFTPPEVMEKLHLNASIYLNYNNLRTEPEHQGNGAQRLLVLTLLEMMAEYIKEEELSDDELDQQKWQQSFLFLIEEPEIYLHPQLQKKMRTALVSISKTSHAQVMCTSHSEHFINLADRHQGIVLLKKGSNNYAKSIQVNENIYSGSTKIELRSRMRMLLNFTSTTLEAFFAERVILVEGDCEIASIHALKSKIIELYPDKEEILTTIINSITIIPCNGKLTQLAFHEVLKHFKIDSYLIHDSDKYLPNKGNNLLILNAIKDESYRLVHTPNFEKYIFNEEWDRDKPWKASDLIYNKFEDHKNKLLHFFEFVIGSENYKKLNI